MQINKLTMISVVVSDMNKAKEFYANKLGLEVKTDYRQDDNNWWVMLALPGGGANITLARSNTTANQPPQSGTVSLYLTTSDIAAAHKELNDKGVQTGEIQDNLYGPGSGVQFLKFEDPDGNWVHIAQE
jgi:catechol 2,3-dioxygenase-like lactoylglutathione lyase family enzyme